MINSWVALIVPLKCRQKCPDLKSTINKMRLTKYDTNTERQKTYWKDSLTNLTLPQKAVLCARLWTWELASRLPCWCLNCSFRDSFRAGNPPPCSQLLLSAFYVSPSAHQFFLYLESISLFYLHPSLCLSGLPFVMLPYLTMLSDTSPLLSAFHLLSLSTSLVFLSLSLYAGLSALSSLSLSTCSSPLCDIARAAHTHLCAHTHSHSCMHTVTESLPGRD